MALDFPSSPSVTDIHNAANGLQYVFDGVKWVSQGKYDTGTINAQKLDNISSNFNGVLTTFNLKVDNITVKPASAESLHIVLAGHLQEPSTAYTINSVNGTITFASAPSNGTAFFGVVLSRLPLADTTGISTITNANVAANAAIDGTKINPNFGSNTITGVTTTQSATDNTTKLASTAFVQTAISNLVDSSPDALNTLNELAAALGDDADFSTTITTALAAKAPLNSPTFTGTVSGISYNDLDNLPTIPSQLTTEQVQDIVGAMVTGNTETGISVTYNDAGDGTGKLDFATTTSSSSSQTFDDNVKAIFGTNNDGLEIYHDGNNSIIDDTGTGDLLLFGTSIKLQRTNSTPESLMIEAFGGNAVKLYYDGALKFETDTAGAKWSGDLFADAFTNSGGGKIKMGPSGALQIYHDNTNSIIDDSGTGSLLVFGSNVIIQESGTSNVMADFHPNTVKLYKNNKEKLITTDNGIEIKGDSSNSTDGSIQLNCSANSHGVKIKSPNHSAGQSYTIILPDNQIAVNKILKVKSVSGSGSTAIGQLEFADDTDTTLPTASSSTLGGIKVGTNLSIDGNGVLSASSGTTVGGANGVSFNDDIRIIFGGTTNEKLELFYNASVNRGIITANTGVHLQFDGSTKIESVNAGVKWHGDLFCDDSISGDVNKIRLGNSADLEIYHDSNNSIIDATGNGSLLFYASDIIFHEKSDAAHKIAEFSQDSSTGCKLYYDNSAKFQTTSSGATLSGNLTVTGTVDGIDIATDVAANTAKVTNATHTGEVTGSGALTIADNVVDEANLKVSNSPTNGYVLTAQSGNTGGLTWAAAGAAETKSTINALYGDNDQLILGNADGDGDDALKLYYNGSSGFITADSGVQLQHDGSTKLSTESTGAKWVGDLFCDDSQYLKLGSSADLQLHHDATNSYIDNGQGDLNLRALTNSTTVQIIAGSEYMARFVKDGAVELYHGMSGSAASKKFETTSYGALLTGNLKLGDNRKVTFGDSDDLQLHHDGSNSYIADTGTGGLRVTSSEFRVNNSANSEVMLNCSENGSVQLRYDNSLKLETLSSGVKWHGDLFCDDGDGGGSGSRLNIGASADLRLFHDATHSYVDEAGNGNLILRTNSSGTYSTIVLQAGRENSLICNKLGSVELFYISGVGSSSKKLNTESTGVQFYGNLRADDNCELRLGNSGDLQLWHDGNNNNIYSATGTLYVRGDRSGFISAGASEWGVKYEVNSFVQLFYDNALKLETQSSGVKWFGDLYCDDNQTIKLGNSADLRLYHDGSHSYISDQGTGSLKVLSNLIEFRDANNSIHTLYIRSDMSSYLYYNGSYKLVTESIGVAINGVLRPAASNSHDLGASDRRWATIYAVNNLNTSDENEKKDINNCDLGLDFVNKINPVSYKWKDEQLGSKTHYGLLAQNIEDAIKSEGKTLDDFGAIHKPQHTAMGLNYNQIIAPLVKAIQELSAKVAVLEGA
tara:strand:- start:891 stop:5276 length:4386 start_codon:yes stop_codon:yes gene_type:complete